MGSSQEERSRQVHVCCSDSNRLLRAPTHTFFGLHSFNSKSPTGKQKSFVQIGRVSQSESNNTLWQVKPWLGICYLPMWLDYVIIDTDQSHSYMICSSPSTTGTGSWLYIMSRQAIVSDDFLAKHKQTAADAGWDVSKCERVLHQSA